MFRELRLQSGGRGSCEPPLQVSKKDHTPYLPLSLYLGEATGHSYQGGRRLFTGWLWGWVSYSEDWCVNQLPTALTNTHENNFKVCLTYLSIAVKTPWSRQLTEDRIYLELTVQRASP